MKSQTKTLLTTAGVIAGAYLLLKKKQTVSGIGYPGAKKPFWYGIPSVQFIYHGEISDPEIYYRGKFYNAISAEDEMYQWWKEELNYGDTTKDFDTWMADNGDRLKNEVIPYMQPTGYMDNYGWRTDY